MKKLLLILAMIFIVASVAWAEDFGNETYNDNSVNWVINGDGNTIINTESGGDAIIGGVGWGDDPAESVPTENTPTVAVPQKTCIFNGPGWISALEFPNTGNGLKVGILTVGGVDHTVYCSPNITVTISADNPKLGLPDRAKPAVEWSLDVSDIPMIRTQEPIRK